MKKITLLLFILFMTNFVQAQSCPTSLNATDCEIFENGTQILQSTRSMKITVSVELRSDAGSFGETTVLLTGDGWVIYDDKGQIEMLDMYFEGATFEFNSLIGDSGIRGNFGFKWIDNKLYIGDNLSTKDEVQWLYFDMSDYTEQLDLSFDDIFPTNYYAEIGGRTSHWTRDDTLLEDYITFIFNVNDGTPFGTSFAQFGALLGATSGDPNMQTGGALVGGLMGEAMFDSMGIDGVAYYTGAFFIDRLTQQPAGFVVSQELIVDYGRLINQAAGGDPLLNMFGNMMLGGDSQITQFLATTVRFVEFDGDYTHLITPPTEEVFEVPDEAVQLYADAGQIGFMPMILQWYGSRLVEVVLLASAGNLPPFATSTPTPIYTPTTTLTPSITPTPTLTYTPSMTYTPTITFTPSMTYTPSSTPTASDTPTATPTATDTSTPTATFTPTITPTATETLIPCTVSASGAINLRSGPGTTFDVRGRIEAGQNQVVNAQELGSDGLIWWRLPDGTWVRSDTVSESGECDKLPTASAGVAPTLIATPPITCILTTRFGVNLRSEPNQQGEQLGSRKAADTFSADAQSLDPQGLTWWRVADGSIDDGLWVREDLVTEDGACSSLPTP